MNKKIILITGCSTGIGKQAAITLTNRGHRVIATCRKTEDVQSLLNQGIESLVLDVNKSESIHTAVHQVMSMTSNHIDVLINNAGYGQAGALEDISRDTIRKQFETNVFGLLELTNLIIPVMRAQGQGRIINVSSILGVISMPFRGAYNASKYALEGLCDTLRLELKSSGIKVISVEPGPIESNFRNNSVDYSLNSIDKNRSYFSRQYKSMLTSYKQKKSSSVFTKSPDAVIAKFIHAIESKRPRAKYPVTIPAHFFILLKRFVPISWMDKILLMISKKELS